ncbi:SsrA-binding protein SmpB [Candidatus Berkelbacteria bacterium]|nr:SsrA-binding protein SmpB [Candidatus Berkelbacteria bacterium]
MGELIIATNKRAWHDYEILEEFEAGLVLTGAEIKAVRDRNVSLQGSFARLAYPPGGSAPELFITNLHIGTPEDPTRSRKLLMKRAEINRLIGTLEQRRLTLIPLRLYLKRSRAKPGLGLARGLKHHDKRERLKQKHRKRALERDTDT